MNSGKIWMLVFLFYLIFTQFNLFHDTSLICWRWWLMMMFVNRSFIGIGFWSLTNFVYCYWPFGYFLHQVKVIISYLNFFMNLICYFLLLLHLYNRSAKQAFIHAGFFFQKRFSTTACTHVIIKTLYTLFKIQSLSLEKHHKLCAFS